MYFSFGDLSSLGTPTKYTTIRGCPIYNTGPSLFPKEPIGHSSTNRFLKELNTSLILQEETV